MSFDIFFQPCRFSSKSVDKKQAKSSTTKSTVEVERLGTAELEAVQRTIERWTIQGPDKFSCHIIGVEDGGEAEVFTDDFGTGCMIALRGITPGMLQFLIDLLKAGNWGMIPVMEDLVVIVPSLESLKNLPVTFPRVVVCNSANELGILLSKGFSTWEKYRNQVIGKKV
jgi:hypothetical protein